MCTHVHTHTYNIHMCTHTHTCAYIYIFIYWCLICAPDTWCNCKFLLWPAMAILPRTPRSFKFSPGLKRKACEIWNCWGNANRRNRLSWWIHHAEKTWKLLPRCEKNWQQSNHNPTFVIFVPAPNAELAMPFPFCRCDGRILLVFLLCPMFEHHCSCRTQACQNLRLIPDCNIVHPLQLSSLNSPVITSHFKRCCEHAGNLKSQFASSCNIFRSHGEKEKCWDGPLWWHFSRNAIVQNCSKLVSFRWCKEQLMAVASCAILCHIVPLHHKHLRFSLRLSNLQTVQVLCACGAQSH